MKKVVALWLVFLFVGIIALQAQESSMFVKTLPIVRVYSHRLGFQVYYLKSDLSLGQFHVPIEWFGSSVGRALMVKGHDRAYPYFSIFWKDGEFYSVKLYVQSNLNHQTWGTLPSTPGLADRFNVETLELEF